MNTKMQAFQDFISLQNIKLPLWGFMFDLILAAILSYIVGRFYVKHGTSLSNRNLFARNFVMLGMCTTLIIAIVKSSLALSLGLVGALSIVRFRAAIKEPEELVYLFLVISIGLGLGASQRIITIVSCFIILGIIWFKDLNRDFEDNKNLFLNISTSKAKNLNLKNITEILKKNSQLVNLRRFDEHDGVLEASFIIDCERFEHLEKSKEELKALDPSLHVTFLDNKGIS